MFRFKISPIQFFLALFMCAPMAKANVSVKIFGDNMVLQRRIYVPVFGTAGPGEKVKVNFRGQQKSTQAGSDSVWKVLLDPMEAGGPFELTLSSGNVITIKNVMVGEVWFCGGQSNMETPLSFYNNYEDTIKVADHPELRMMDERKKGKWVICTPLTAPGFSATAYFFGREVQRTLGVSVGLIQCAVGGTTIERWMDPQTIANEPSFRTIPVGIYGDLFRTRMAPLVGFGIRGMIWYQGEQNSQYPTAFAYRRYFESLIKGYRQIWNMGDFPFFYVQLANWYPKQIKPMDTCAFAEIRESQRLSLTTRNTSMASAIDIGEAGTIHPHNKRDVGLRLALPAKALVYGMEMEYSGPLFESMEIEGDKALIHFTHLGDGLMTPNGAPLEGFAIAGSDKKFVWGRAQIEKGTVIVRSAEIAHPAFVRYAFAFNPIGNLYNSAGLPASPFRSENEPLPRTQRVFELPPISASPIANAWGSSMTVFDPIGRKIFRKQTFGSDAEILDFARALSITGKAYMIKMVSEDGRTIQSSKMVNLDGN